jgi:hypothetical protein
MMQYMGTGVTQNAVLWVVTPAPLVKTDDSEECIASIIRVKRISRLETMLALTSN